MSTHSNATGANSVNTNGASIESLLRREEKIVNEIGEMANDATNLVKNFTTQKFERAKASLAQAQSSITDGAKHYASSTDNYVHTNPWTSLGIAVAGGLLIGMLIARR